MGWKQEDRDIKRAHYSGYCTMSKELGVNRQDLIPYHSFTEEIYNSTRIKFKSYKKKKLMEIKNKDRKLKEL